MVLITWILLFYFQFRHHTKFLTKETREEELGLASSLWGPRPVAYYRQRALVELFYHYTTLVRVIFFIEWRQLNIHPWVERPQKVIYEFHGTLSRLTLLDPLPFENDAAGSSLLHRIWWSHSLSHYHQVICLPRTLSWLIRTIYLASQVKSALLSAYRRLWKHRSTTA